MNTTPSNPTYPHTIEQLAYERGFNRGSNDALAFANKNLSPLSGEWAGESITELLGDLLAHAENRDEDEDEICTAYENGYSVGYDDPTIE